MSDRRDPDLTPQERVTRDALNALARPRPDAAFRARLRQEFVSGRIGRRRGVVGERTGFARPLVWLPMAATCALAVALFFNRGPDWRVNAVSGEGNVRVDGVVVAGADVRSLGALLRRGGHVQVEGALTVDVVAPGLVAVAIAPGAEVTLPPAPNRWFSRRMQAQLASGDVYFTTGRQFHGATLEVTTAHARVLAVGTAFAVLCGDSGTCVCVLEGTVRVGDVHARVEDGIAVPHGMRRVLRPDRAAETLPILDDSAHHLHRQMSSVGSALGRK